MESRKTFADLPELDFNIVKDKDWAESMWKRLSSGLEKTFLAWITIVSRLSDKTDDINGWVKIFEENFEDTCCELVSDMEQLRSSVVRKIEEFLKTIQQHCKTLKIEMPEFGNEKLGLFQAKLLLQKRIDEYELVINKRQGELDRLRHKQLELCQYLGKEPKIIQDEPLPSEEEVAVLQKHVEKLEQERFNRMETFYEMKQTILDCIAELKYKPSTEFEKGVINSDNFKVSNENMKLLSRFHKNLKEQLKDVKEEINQLWHKITNLWDVLDIALLEREHFKQSNKDASIETLENLRKELARCQDLKKANIEVFITKLRDELDNLWEKCHCTKEEGIAKFGFYTSDCYTEDLLELYEIEVEKWKRYYAENNEILTLLTKHNTLWLKMKQFEEMSGNPGRLNNRGGQLLKEEKERNMLAKKIPSIEENLISMADKYETRYGIPFRTFGLTILEYFENLRSDRENAKKEKSSARKMHNTQTPVTCGKSKTTLFTSTSSSNSKRKLTPKTSSAQKKMKLTSTVVSSEPTRRKLVIPKITVTTTTLTKRRSVERRLRLERKRRSARHLHNETNTTEYGDFQNELSGRNDCRSTMNPMSFPVVMGDSTPRKLTPRTPSSIKSRPRTPSNIKTTPSSSRTPNNKLTVTKSNLKLIF